jgi:hypothetical protein
MIEKDMASDVVVDELRHEFYAAAVIFGNKVNLLSAPLPFVKKCNARPLKYRCHNSLERVLKSVAIV